MKITSIALDLDGTTLNSQGVLSERTRRALVRAAQSGICVIPASGRSFDSLPGEILRIPEVRYVITSNGTAVVDVHTGTYLRKFVLTEESVENILLLMEDEEVAYEAFIDGKAYAQSAYVEDPVRFGAMPQAISYIQGTRAPIEDMRTFICEHKSELDCIDLVVKNEDMKHKLWKNLRENVRDVYITSSVRQLLEISHRDAGKESGAKFLLEYLGLTREELAAFGDGDNDSGLLKYAGIGFAVANASPECRDAADEIVASNDENGVAQGINKILAM